MESAEQLEIIDTHAHLDMEDFDADRDDILERSRRGIFPEIKGKTIETGSVRFMIRDMVIPGITAKSCLIAARLAEKYPFFHPGAGIHPNHLTEIIAGDWETITALAMDPKTVAIGETGLDLHWNASPLLLQVEYLLRHFLLAKKRKLPIIIHCRDAEDELMNVVRNFRSWEKGESISDEPGYSPLFEQDAEQLLSLPPMKGVIHSYSGGPERAAELIEFGFYLGFTGSVTFTGRKFAMIGEAAKILPDDRFLLETDSPFLIPHPFRGKLDRNEPLMSAWTARRLAELRATTVAEIVRQTTENARRLFGIKQ